MSSSTRTSVAFFGATGGVVNATLVHSLLAGYKATALARSPDKLRKQLTDQGIDESVIGQQLTIVQGNALDVSAVKQALTAGPSDELPTHILSGLGGSPKLNLDWRHPLHIAALDNDQICETAAKTLVTALGEIYAEKPALKANKPLMMFVSTTGITCGPEDVPFALRFLYHQILAIPHADKKKMEDTYRGEMEKQDSVFRNVIGIRPTLLSGQASYTDAAGLENVRWGLEPKPATGWNIKRADVGHWIYQNAIDEKTRKPELEGQMISLTS